MTAPTPADDEPTRDWTCDETGRSNSSTEFGDMVVEVARLLRDGGAGVCLSLEWARSTARLVMAQLAHVHGLSPSGRAGVSPQPEITRQQIADLMADEIADHAWVHGTGEISGDGIDRAADAVWALLADGATPAGPEVHPRFRPDWAVHPGEILQEEIDERGMTQVELAGALGFSAKHVNMLIKGNADIEAPCAVRLERVLGISAELWLGLQQAYDLHHARVGATPAEDDQP